MGRRAVDDGQDKACSEPKPRTGLVEILVGRIGAERNGSVQIEILEKRQWYSFGLFVCVSGKSSI